MVTTIGVRETIKSFKDLETKLNLTQTEDDNFFREWYEDLPEITKTEKKALDRIKKRYDYHRSLSPLLEGTINLVVVSPLLEVAGFLDPPFRGCLKSHYHLYSGLGDPPKSPLIRGTLNQLPPFSRGAGGDQILLKQPFRIKSPESVELIIEDSDQTIIKGLIDILVVHQYLWVLVVESKRTSIPVALALPQILAYMMANSNQDKSTYGMATNGDSFIFIKLTHGRKSEYDISREFSLLPRKHELPEVLQILKKLG